MKKSNSGSTDPQHPLPPPHRGSHRGTRRLAPRDAGARAACRHICTGGLTRASLTFAKGASPKGPSGLFNSGLDGNVRRAIDIREGEKIDPAALKLMPWL
jgi:hypothetical protein